MLGILRIFFSAQGANPWTVLFCLLLAGLFEIIGLASLLPLLSMAGEDQLLSSSPINEWVVRGLGWIGLAPRFDNLLLLIIAAITIKTLLSLVAMRYVSFAVADVATNLRRRLVDQILNVRWNYFVSEPVGSIANAIGLESTRSGFAYSLAAQFVATAIQTVIYVAVALLVSWRVAVIALVIGGVIAVSLAFLIRLSKRSGRRQTRRTAELVTTLTDTVVNIKPLKAMARQTATASLLESKIEGLKQALRIRFLSQFAMKHTKELLTALFLGLVLYIAVTFTEIGLAELVVTGVLLVQILTSIGRIQAQLQKAVVVESAYWSVQRLIDKTSDAREDHRGSITPTLDRAIRFSDIGFSFGDQPVLTNMNLSIPAKKVTVISGPSGSGKTTITDLILGFYQPEAGRICIDDVPLEEVDIHAWRRMVGYVPQELILFNETIGANVSLGDSSVTTDAIRDALEKAGAWPFVASLPEGLATPVGERGLQLSGGQRQRIALARALVKKPTLLILDEVTSALDPDTEAEICERISALSVDMTILAITHRPALTGIADVLHTVDGAWQVGGEQPSVTAVGD